MESKIAQGNKGGILNEMNKNLKAENERIKQDNAKLLSEVENLKFNYDKANSDNHV